MVDPSGVSAHETAEGKTKRYKHIGRLNPTEGIKEFATNIEEKLSNPDFIRQMMNPVLVDRVFLALPNPQNPGDCLEVHGRRAKINEAHLQSRLLCADELPQSKHNLFLAFRKARTRYHIDGFLVYVNPMMKFFVGIAWVTDFMSKIGLSPKFYKDTSYIPCDAKVQGKMSSARQDEINIRTAFASLSHLIIKSSGPLKGVLKRIDDAAQVTKVSDE